MKIVVTGAAGFIGANIVKALNGRGVRDIIAVDNLEKAAKFRNLVDCDIADYVDKRDFRARLLAGAFGRVEAILHQGACSDTMEIDGRYMMENNYRYSVDLLDWCQQHQVPYIYASSAAVYGMGPAFKEDPVNEGPLNVYGYSKFLFDQVVRRRLAAGLRAPVVGLRYFNVYGPRESHKGRMASVALHHFNQFRADGKVRLFEGSHGYANGEQRRDFVYVDDVVRVNLHFLDRAGSGIFNLGTGRAQPFNDVALAVVNTMQAAGTASFTLAQAVQRGLIEYITFPEALKGKYQAFTQADLTQLRAAGYEQPFQTVEEGTATYVRWLLAQPR